MKDTLAEHDRCPFILSDGFEGTSPSNSSRDAYTLDKDPLLRESESRALIRIIQLVAFAEMRLKLENQILKPRDQAFR